MKSVRRLLLPVCALPVAVAVGCADTGGLIGPEEGGSSAARVGAVGQAPVRTIDQYFARRAAEIPGFGGYYFDDETLVVRLTDPAQAGRARAVLAGQPGLDRQGKQMRFVPAEFGFAELKGWGNRLTPVLGLPGVVFTDIDEVRNRLAVGVEDEDARSRVMARVAELGIPSSAVIVELAEPIRLASTLQDYNRPVRGGLRIESPTKGDCTLGFNANRSGVRSFITNSHCTAQWASVTGTPFYQSATGNSAHFVGTEVLDPPFFTSAQNPACPWGRLCRYSDAAAVNYDPAVAWDFSYIARTTWRGQYSGSLTIDAANPRFWITSKRFTSPVAGSRMEKMGQMTGWTTGLISQTCTNYNVANTSVTLLCQERVDAGAQGGDSGSPVFYWWDPEKVTLFGILWGRSDNDTRFYFSWIGHVESELGSMSVFQPSGGPWEDPPPPDPCEDPTVIVC